jgi:hypothetical protein
MLESNSIPVQNMKVAVNKKKGLCRLLSWTWTMKSYQADKPRDLEKKYTAIV